MLILSQQYTLFMVFILLCFAGLMVMFYFMLRSMEEMTRSIREERNSMNEVLRSIEKRIAQLVTLQRHEQTLSEVSQTAAPKKGVHYNRDGEVVFEEAVVPFAEAGNADAGASSGSAFPAGVVAGIAGAAITAGVQKASGAVTVVDDSAAYSEAVEFDDAQAAEELDGTEYGALETAGSEPATAGETVSFESEDSLYFDGNIASDACEDTIVYGLPDEIERQGDGQVADNDTNAQGWQFDAGDSVEVSSPADEYSVSASYVVTEVAEEGIPFDTAGSELPLSGQFAEAEEGIGQVPDQLLGEEPVFAPAETDDVFGETEPEELLGVPAEVHPAVLKDATDSLPRDLPINYDEMTAEPESGADEILPAEELEMMAAGVEDESSVSSDEVFELPLDAVADGETSSELGEIGDTSVREFREVPDLHLEGLERPATGRAPEKRGLFLFSPEDEEAEQGLGVGVVEDEDSFGFAPEAEADHLGIAASDTPVAEERPRPEYRFSNIFDDEEECEAVGVDDVILLTPDEIVREDEDGIAFFDPDESLGVDEEDDTLVDMVEDENNIVPEGLDDPVDMDSALAKALAAAGIDNDTPAADGHRYLSDVTEDAVSGSVSDEELEAGESLDFVWEDDTISAAKEEPADGAVAGDEFDFSSAEEDEAGDDQTILPGFFEAQDVDMISDEDKLRREKAAEEEESGNRNITDFIVPE
ncbi:hypothetical protein N1030_06250 [Desulfovibrio mangrovi]|uniref:hypothetical protein n=1 Tax=Desulfovibrio mangrovi TaxID=2976983 RepID=UPI002247A92A|nr:hypothetical protein [Desulfovibrio mangrovi]UZP68570.1 hypothetical protein N1030_06250 [Desulfovibrio mangrovi]